MTIPASAIVRVYPSVVDTGGVPLSLNGVYISKNARIPAGAVPSFVSSDSVRDYFGYASDEYSQAQKYFLGFDNSTIKPGTVFFAPFADAYRGAWIRSGSFKGVTLDEIKAITPGTLTVDIGDGTPKTSSSINLATAASFGDAASEIQAAFTLPNFAVSWDAIQMRFVLTEDITPQPADKIMPVYCTGTIADSLRLTSAKGAILSGNMFSDTADTAMQRLKEATQNWVSFTTMWEPNITEKKAFAAWTTSQDQRYVYVCWDTDGQALVDGSTSCFGQVAKDNNYDAVCSVYDNLNLASFVMGTIASIDFSRRNGRITAAFKSQEGLSSTIDNQQQAEILLANGYSFYGKYATANDEFVFLYNGQISGKWKWLDAFADQVWLNSQLQLSLISLLTAVKSIPYNPSGYNLIRAAMQDPIKQALNFGAIRTGIQMSESQKAQVNQAAGKDISMDIELMGYYLQILDPGAQVRGMRGTPVINFWFADGGAVQKISLASIDIM